MKKKQRGLSLLGLIVVSAFLISAALVGIKVAPSVIEYYSIVKAIKTIAAGPEGRGTVADIRRAYDNFAIINNVTSITATDLDVGKEGNDVVISFEYEKKIRLVGNVSLCIDYAGSSSTSGRPTE